MTLEEEKRLVLLAAILILGGNGSKASVLDTVENHDLYRLTHDDRLTMITRDEARWRNDLAFVRKHLVQEGMVANVRFNDWRITDPGRTYAKALALRASSLPGIKANLNVCVSEVLART